MTDPVVSDRIQQDISDNPVVLYMKGTPNFPQCGFSAAVVQVLNHLGVKFKGVDVLADNQVRQGIKEFSNWPTIPQLYVKGEFVGGCDIVREMFESGAALATSCRPRASPRARPKRAPCPSLENHCVLRRARFARLLRMRRIESATRCPHPEQGPGGPRRRTHHARTAFTSAAARSRLGAGPGGRVWRGRAR